MKTTFENELNTRGVLVFTNVGTSMMPLLRQHRDLMIIHKRPEGRLKKYDAVLFKRGEKYVLHRIVKVLKDGYWIVGDNQTCREFVKDEQILGVLKGVVRDGVEYSASDPRRKWYLLWVMLRRPTRNVYYKVRHFLRILTPEPIYRIYRKRRDARG